jgi:hypothetical protein
MFLVRGPADLVLALELVEVLLDGSLLPRGELHQGRASG